MNTEHQNLHFVFIVDQQGINNISCFLKTMIVEYKNSYLTFVYSIFKDNKFLLFKTNQLGTDYITVESNELHYHAQFQNILETIISSNIDKILQFIICGKLDLVELGGKKLHFLGIRPTQISTQIC